MTSTLINTAHIVFLVAGLSAVIAQFSVTETPDTLVDETVMLNVTFIPDPALVPTPAAAPAMEDMPHVVITGRRMTPEEKAVFDAQQELYSSARLNSVPLP